MLARFLGATLSAAAVAVGLAGGAASLRAQALPAAQAAPAEKQAKAPKQWPPDAATLEKRRLDAEALPLFTSLEPIDVTITADFKTIQRDRDDDSKQAYPGTLAITTGGATGPAIPIQLRTRGHVRRSERLCSFAPLRVEFQKATVKGTVFEGQGALKLGTHCQGDAIYQQYVLKEYLANRLQNVLTPRSVRARLARVTYADTDAGKKPYTKPGIFFEDVDDMAKRVGMRELSVPRQVFAYVDQAQLLFMSLFQYMIGNTDYSIMTLHNVFMLDDVKGVRYTVPYDFDYSGLVGAHYATPAKGLALASVQDRFYRGPCKTEAEVAQALEPFRQKQAELLTLPASVPGLEEGHRRSTEKYLNAFFELVSRPDKVKKVFVTECQPIAGM